MTPKKATAQKAKIKRFRTSKPLAYQQALAIGGGNSTHGTTTCEGVQSCNDFIALCAEAGGDFTPTEDDPNGAPKAGECKTN